MRRNSIQARSLAGGGKSFLNVADALAVDVQPIAHFSAALSRAAQVRQESRRNLDGAPFLSGAPAASDIEINCLRIEIHLRPPQGQNGLLASPGVNPDQYKERQIEPCLRRLRSLELPSGF